MSERVRDRSVASTVLGNEYIIENDGSKTIPVRASYTGVRLDVMTDVVTRKYKELSAKGEIINSPMTKHKSNWSVDAATVRLDREVGASFRSWGVEGSYAPSGAYDLFSIAMPDSHRQKVLDEIARSEGLAVTDAYGNVGSPDVAVLTELAELRETLGFLMSPLKGMVSLTKRFKGYVTAYQARELRYAERLAKYRRLPEHIRAKRAPPDPVKHPPFRVRDFQATDISSAWLAYRYGLMPLIYTFQGVSKMLKTKVEDLPQRVTTRGKASGVVDLSSSVTTVHPWGSGGYSIRHEHDIRCKVVSRAGVLSEADTRLQARLGIGWSHIPKAAYEVIPLSFVTDWFHNGAAYYDALTAEARTGKILAAWVTTTVEYDFVFTDHYVLGTNGIKANGGTRRGTVNGKWHRRRPVTVADVKLGLRVQLNSKRVADGLALIHTILMTIRKH